jgi:nucleoside permease NupC
MNVTQIDPNGSETPVAAPAQVHTVDSSHRLASMIDMIMGFALLAAAVNLALGGVCSGIHFHLLGSELPLSCLASPMALIGTLLVLVARRPSTGAAE